MKAFCFERTETTQYETLYRLNLDEELLAYLNEFLTETYEVEPISLDEAVFFFTKGRVVGTEDAGARANEKVREYIGETYLEMTLSDAVRAYLEEELFCGDWEEGNYITFEPRETYYYM